MEIKGVLFDFDGTLADTLPVCFYSFRRVFKEIDDRVVSDQEIVSMFGPSEVGIMEQNIQNKEFISKAIEDYYTYYEQEHSSLVEPNSDILFLLESLKKMKIKMGIVTGKARKSLEISMDKLNLSGFFDVIMTGDDVEKPKPDPEGVLKAMKALHLDDEETIFIGDSNADIEAGKKAKLPTIGVHWLETVQSANFEITPDFLYKNVIELLQYIKSRELSLSDILDREG